MKNMKENCEMYDKMVEEARDRAKRLGAQSDEDAICILEQEVREYRASHQGMCERLKEKEEEIEVLREELDSQKKLTENTRNTYENICDRLTKEIHRQRIMLNEFRSECGQMEELKESRAPDANLNVNVTIMVKEN